MEMDQIWNWLRFISNFYNYVGKATVSTYSLVLRDYYCHSDAFLLKSQAVPLCSITLLEVIKEACKLLLGFAIVVKRGQLNVILLRLQFSVYTVTVTVIC